MFEVVIFDLCGVLTKNKPVFSLLKKVSHYKGTVRSAHTILYADYVKATLGEMSDMDFWKKVKERTKSRRRVENIRKDFIKDFKINFDKKIFEEVKKYFRTALCTNFMNVWWKEVKKNMGISFEYELVSSSIGMRKPVKQVFMKIVEFFETLPKDCVYVGDETDDLIGAKQAGMNTVYISNNKKYDYADYVYPNVEEFMNAII